jgi:hypothetical protein
MKMEKDKLIAIVIAILGLSALAAPILASEDISMWVWGLIVTRDGEVHYLTEQTSSSEVFFTTMFTVSTAIFTAGLVLYFLLEIMGKIQKMPAWLPGLIMTIGMGFPVGYTIIGIIQGAVVPIGAVTGLVAGIWSWILGAQASMPKT